MSSPRVIIQVAVAGAQILGKAFLAAGRQAVANAKHRPGAAEEVAGVRGGADGLTQTHRMTLDEAHLILNAKKGDALPQILKNYEVLFKANSPPEAPTAQATAAPAGARSRAAAQRFHSHYIQSKIVRARERIEAELEIQQEAENAQRAGEQAAESTNTPPPPNPPPSSS